MFASRIKKKLTDLHTFTLINLNKILKEKIKQEKKIFEIN